MNDKELIEKKLKGTATFFKDGQVEFVPQGEGSPKYELAQKVGQGAVYKTAGERSQSFIAHLKVNAESEDPAADLQQQLDKLTAKMWPDPKPVTPRGRVLLKEDGCLCTQNAAKGELQINITIDLRKHVDYMKQYYKLQNNINLCLHSNDDSLRQLCRALATSSTK